MTDSNFRCEACDITLNSIDQYMQHTSGRSHLNKLQQSAAEVNEENNHETDKDKTSSELDSSEETIEDPFRKVVFATDESPSSLPPIDLPAPPPPPRPTPRKRKAEVVMDGCDICQVFYNSPDQKDIHLKGKKHQKKMNAMTANESPSSLSPSDLPTPQSTAKKRKTEELMDGCDICQVVYNSPDQKDIHLNGKKHQKKMKAMTEVSPSDPLGLSSVSTTNLGSCELCHVNYTSVTIRDQHLNGAKHRRKVELSQSTHQEVEMCDLCNVKYTSPSNKLLHIQGRKHQRNVQSHSTPETAPVKNATCFRCMFCNISVNSLDQLEIHRQGTKHKAILQKMKTQQQGGVVDDRSVVVVSEEVND